MKFRILLAVITVFININSYAQEIAQFRKMGFEAMQNGNYKIAVRNYSKIINKQSDDYDARLALGKLYYKMNQCDSSMVYYKLIYANDTTDVEALNGFTRCFIRQGKLDSAIACASKSLVFLPTHVPQYLLLAKAYSFKGHLNKAIAVYQQANQIDSTWSEVWAGLGKMYYWQSKPTTAGKYYKRALALDSSNMEIRKAFQVVEKELQFKLDISEKYLEEAEETYEINAIIQRVDLQKQITDKFQLSGHVILDYSMRDFEDDRRDTISWYDNSWVKASFIAEKNLVNLYVGASNSDKKLTAYGFSWRYRSHIHNVKIENAMDAGYDYFYYWNKVGRFSAENKLKLNYRALSANFNLSAGLIDAKPVQDLPSDPRTNKQNPYYSYTVQGSWKITNKPTISIGVEHSFLTYKYIARDYYTPRERFLAGPMATIYYSYKGFYIYGMYAYNFGNEKYYYLGSNNLKQSGDLNVDNWSASADMGYNFKNSSISAGISRFYNPYYQNALAFIKLTLRF